MAVYKRYSASSALVMLILIIICLSFSREEGLKEEHELDSCANWDIRLAGGPNEFEGRVEICQEGMWGQVCGCVDPKVVCRHLISPEVIPEGETDKSLYYIPQADAGNSKGEFVVENLMCNGNESKLDECSSTVRNDSNGCYTNDRYAFVLCQDPMCFTNPESVRLVDGASETEGRVEVCHHSLKFRRGVCDTNWDCIDAFVTCKEFNSKSPRATLGHNAMYAGSAFYNVSCVGNEDKLSHCNRSETLSFPDCTFAGVICQNQSAMTDLPLATAPSSYVTPVPNCSIKMTAGPDTSYSSETTQLLQTNTQTNSIGSEMATDIESTSSPSVSNQVTIIGIAFGAFGGLLILLVLILIILLVFVFLILAGRKQKNSTLTQSIKSTDHSLRYTENDKTSTQRNGNQEIERVLMNPIYTKTTLSPSLSPPHEYATLEESQSSNFAPHSINEDNSPYYSTPTPLLASYNSGTKLISNHSTPAGPEDHLYDDTVPNSCHNITPSTVDVATRSANSDTSGALNEHLYEQPPLDNNLKPHYSEHI